MAEEKEKSNQLQDEKNPLEWTVFGISLLLVLGIIAFLTYKTFTHQPSPPEIVVTSIPDPSPDSPYRYHLSIANKGGATAEEVIVEVVLIKTKTVLEKSELHFPFVPKSSTREGWVIFTQDPAKADSVYTRVVSFKKP